MNSKLIALMVTFLAVGVGVGFGLGYMTYEPQLSKLRSELSELKSGFTFDKSIQILDFAIDEEGYNTYITGKAKNIGKTFIKRLYVFAFQYDPNGLLLEMQYRRTEIIWPNQSMPFDMSFRTVEGQKFKVLAVGNY